MPEPGNPQALNRYSYVANSPTKYVDPSGHCWGIASGLRGTALYGTTCANLDMALTIVQSPNATAEQKLLAGGYIAAEGVAHAALVVGAVGLACSAAGPACVKSVEAAIGIGTAACVDDACAGEVSLAQQVVKIPANQIRFTQDTISPYTKAGVPLDTLTQEIANGAFRGTVRVVEHAGKIYSLDNRRLAAFRLLDMDVPVTIEHLSNPATLAEFSRKFTTLNDGISIVIRGIGLTVK